MNVRIYILKHTLYSSKYNEGIIIITKIYKVIIMLEQHKRSSQKFSKLQHHILFLLKAIVCYKELLTKWKLIIKQFCCGIKQKSSRIYGLKSVEEYLSLSLRCTTNCTVLIKI